MTATGVGMQPRILDDDNDGYLDVEDNCPTVTWASTSMQTTTVVMNEDKDNDGDGIENHLDLCPNGAQYWAGTAEDNDGDGCRDADEDDNDDNDPFLDSADDCPSGTSVDEGDFDGDEFADTTEDNDWDNDGVTNLNVEDTQTGAMELVQPFSTTLTWTFATMTTEDDDWDNDGVTDLDDRCLGD